MTTTEHPPTLLQLVDKPYADTPEPLRAACLLFPLLCPGGLLALAYTVQSTPIGLAGAAALAAFVFQQLYAYAFDTYEHPPIRRLVNFTLGFITLTVIFMLIAAFS